MRRIVCSRCGPRAGKSSYSRPSSPPAAVRVEPLGHHSGGQVLLVENVEPLIGEHNRVAFCLLDSLPVSVVDVLEDGRPGADHFREPVAVVVGEGPGEAVVLGDHVAVCVVGVCRGTRGREPVERNIGIGGSRALHHLYPVAYLIVGVGDRGPGAAGGGETVQPVVSIRLCVEGEDVSSAVVGVVQVEVLRDADFVEYARRSVSVVIGVGSDLAAAEGYRLHLVVNGVHGSEGTDFLHPVHGIVRERE